jgi:hypothetical protein
MSIINKYLLDEPPLQLLPTLAKLIGLHEAIILQQIYYWQILNQKTGKNYRNGYHWTYNTYEDWQAQFPFLSLSTIKRTINRLESQNLLVSDNFNRIKIDRTKWYRVDLNTLESLIRCPLGQSDTMDSVNLTSPLPETIQKEGNPSHELGILSAVSQSMKPNFSWNRH